MFAWQRFDSGLAENEWRSFFNLFLLFASLSFALFLVLMLFWKRLRASEAKAQAARSYSSALMRGSETERKRVAFELHDDILPDLRRLAADAPAANSAAINGLGVKIRAICERLLPPDFGRVSFSDSLLSLGAAFAKRHPEAELRASISPTLSVGALSAEAQLHCYRMVEEALNNIEKHAMHGTAQHVILVARNTGAAPKQALLLCVSNDVNENGIVRAPRAVGDGSGIGLRSIHERAALLHGKAEFIDEGGTVMLRIEIPLE
jgi:two-component system NarL family sensor kinase